MRYLSSYIITPWTTGHEITKSTTFTRESAKFMFLFLLFLFNFFFFLGEGAARLKMNLVIENMCIFLYCLSNLINTTEDDTGGTTRFLINWLYTGVLFEQRFSDYDIMVRRGWRVSIVSICLYSSACLVKSFCINTVFSGQNNLLSALIKLSNHWWWQYT